MQDVTTVRPRGRASWALIGPALRVVALPTPPRARATPRSTELNVKKRSSSPLSPRAQSRLQPSQASKAAALRVGTAALLAPGVRCPPAAAAMAPKAEKKPAKKVVKASGGKGKKGKKSVETYKIYIYKVLKQVRFCPAAALSAACCLSNPP